MNDNTTLKDWVDQLPEKNRIIAQQFFGDKKVRRGFTCFDDFLEYAISEIECTQTLEQCLPTYLLWKDLRNMRARYINGEAGTYYCSWWHSPTCTKGMPVIALDMNHAMDIVCAKNELNADQIIYVHAKDSTYKEQSHGK